VQTLSIQGSNINHQTTSGAKRQSKTWSYDMRIALAIALGAALLTGQPAVAQTPTPATETAADSVPQKRERKKRAEKAAATEAPKSIAECNTMLNDIGGAIQGAKLSGAELAELRIKGATMSSLCEQSKFKDAFDAHNNAIGWIKSHKARLCFQPVLTPNQEMQ
jgi:hypothetical protein